MTEPCPDCFYESSGVMCDRQCDRPACGPCDYDRWATANPVEALEDEYDRACTRAQSAEEGDWPDWRQDVAYAEYLARVLEEIEERRAAGASYDELAGIARSA